MALPGQINSFVLTEFVEGTYQIEQSLRFNTNSDTEMQKNFSVEGSRDTCTTSVWIKRGKLDVVDYCIWSSREMGGYWEEFTIYSDGSIYATCKYNNATRWNMRSNALLRDPLAWYHLVYVRDTANSTQADRIRLYVNGVRVDSWAVQTEPATQGLGGFLGGNFEHKLGKRAGYDDETYDGYMAEFHFLDGTSRNADSFGEFDNRGVWRPIEYTGGGYGDNGIYLKFDPAATNGIGEDYSGNGHTMPDTSFTTSGPGTDVFSDTPTTNYPTWNPLALAESGIYSMASHLSDGNLVAAMQRDNGDGAWTANFAIPISGKWYWEVEQLTAGTPNPFISTGIIAYPWTWNSSDHVRYDSRGRIGKDWNDVTYQSVSAWGAGYGSASDVCGVAVDADNNTVQFYKNGTSQGTTESYSGSTYTYIPHCTTAANTDQNVRYNFGQRDFAYTPPTGFNALNTRNLSAPTVKDGSDYFNTVLYGGNNGTLTVTGLGFSPDLVWIKNREVNGAGHAWQDQVRGATAFLFSNSTASENTDTANDWFRDFTSDGFTVAATTTGGTASSEWNNNGSGYVAWCWDAGGSGSSNTDGSITSTVSANPSAGFSISTFTASTFAIETIGHGLGVAPSLIIVKKRSATEPWYVWHKDFTVSQYLRLNDASSLQTSSNLWGTSPPSSTVFGYYPTVGDHVAYCFAEVPGYSSIGSYVGNGNDDGPFLYTGFRPSFLLYRRTDSGQPWYILDSSRNTYNPFDNLLAPDLTDAEDSATIADFLSNGVKLRNSLQTSNASGGSYIYMAFAEHPLGGDGVSPATAR